MRDSQNTGAARVLDTNADSDTASSFATLMNERLARVVFQPIVSLQTHEVFAYEALGRSLSPHFDGPVALFEAAVRERRVGELGRLLRMMAVDGCTTHPLFVNVNPNEFDEGWLVQPDDPIFWHEHQVYLEITESVPLSHFALCKQVLGELRAKGVYFAIDDLGAGYSNLKYISDLEPHVVKVDRELVAGVGRSPRQYRLLESIVHLCVRMGAAVVVEGIETPEELQAARDAGAQYGQGFLLGLPDMPPGKATWPVGF